MRRWFDIAKMRLLALVRARRMDEQLEKEPRFHIDRQTEEYMLAGMSPDQARRAARMRLGGFTQIEEECRDMRHADVIENFFYDVRHSLRAMRKSPAFAAVMIVTLALAIGANSAIFSVVRGVLLRPLPYPQQDRIVRLFLSNASFPKFPFNPFDFRDFRARGRSFDGMAIMTRSDLQLSGVGEPQRLTGFQVSAAYFRVLGMRPERGREFDFQDETPGRERSVILSDRLWRTRFNANPNIVGTKIRLDGRPYEVVGVMPPQMLHPGNEYRPVAYGDTVDIWTPFTFAGNSNQRGSHFTEVIARMKRGVTLSAATAEAQALMAQLAREYPNNDSGWRVLVVPIYREIVGSRERLLLVLLVAVGLVLLIACANAANLLLARATQRRREMAVRLALGAARTRLVRQMLTESLVISALGAAGAALVAAFGVKILVAMLPAGFPRAGEVHLDFAVFLFTLVVALATGVFFGLAPALQSSNTDVHRALKEDGRGAIGSARHLQLRNWLVVTEVGLACVLLIGAGLLLRSFVKLLRTDAGFRPEHVLTASIALPRETYKPPVALQFYERLAERLRQLPAVEAAGIGSDLPWTGYDDNLGGFQIEGKQPPPHQDFHARYHQATPGYFRALGIPLLSGRFFEAGDNLNARPALIINRAMAQRYWPGEDAVGKRINFFSDHPTEKDWTTIVGVVGDVKDTPEKASAEPAFWWPVAQTPFGFANTAIVIRAKSDPAVLIGAVRQTLRELDPTLALADVRLMDQIADASISAPRFTLFLVGLFASLAIVLAAIGTYGVISYSVNQRMHEFGMRVALGAKPWDVLRLVLRQGLKLSLAGVALGAACALALAQALRKLLFEVSAVDPLTFAVVGAVVLAVGILACYLPARRATQADPMVALRAE